MRMDKTHFGIISRNERQNDYAYWLSKSPVERLAALELLRQQFIRFRKDVQPRLQRVWRIVKRK